MCQRWNDDHLDLTDGTWSGSVNGCDPGELSLDAIDDTLKLVNLYRWLADLPAVTTDAAENAVAQSCSLMMEANNTISHTPYGTWTCFDAVGSDGAGRSNLATTSSVAAIPLYMVDPGNESTLGHRRWILSNWLGPIGVGGADTYSCLVVIGGDGDAAADWTAFPSPGPFPTQAMDLGWAHVDETGWHIQSDTRDFNGATVEVTRGGQSLQVTTSIPFDWYGSVHALAWTPVGWASSAGTYDIAIRGAGAAINYQVVLTDCAASSGT
jgi:hypothetical protein